MKKKLVAGSLTLALVGADQLFKAEYVYWNDEEKQASIIQSSQLNKIYTNKLTNDIIEPVIMYKALQQWTCSACVPSGPIKPPPTGDQKVDWGVAKIKAPEAHKINNGSTVKVGIADTGLDQSHPDVKALGGRNFTSSATGAWQDGAGHGTHVAGLVAAVNNDFGVVGASQAQLVIAKVLGDNGSGSNEMIANGIAWLAQTGVKVINLSLGGPQSSSILLRACQYATGKGVKLVVAAGNDGSSRPSYPAAFNIPGLFAVSALEQSLQKTDFSSWGSHIKMACPGRELLSTCKGNRYCNMSGTSMASPVCAGALAVAIAAGKPLKFQPLGNPQWYGQGMPDLLATLQ